MSNRFLYIIVAIVLVILVNPHLRSLGLLGHLTTTLFIALIPLTCAFALITDRNRSLVILLLAVPFVITDGLDFFIHSQALTTVKFAAAVFLYFYIIVLMVKYLLSIKNVTANMIYCAISTYLLIGIGWAGIYQLVELGAPGSFSGTPDVDLLYFSFVTLTTLGFGDVLPQTALSQRLVVFEATMGSIYMAVIVAMIVGRYMSMHDAETGDDDKS